MDRVLKDMDVLVRCGWADVRAEWCVPRSRQAGPWASPPRRWASVCRCPAVRWSTSPAWTSPPSYQSPPPTTPRETAQYQMSTSVLHGTSMSHPSPTTIALSLLLPAVRLLSSAAIPILVVPISSGILQTTECHDLKSSTVNRPTAATCNVTAAMPWHWEYTLLPVPQGYHSVHSCSHQSHGTKGPEYRGTHVGTFTAHTPVQNSNVNYVIHDNFGWSKLIIQKSFRQLAIRTCHGQQTKIFR